MNRGQRRIHRLAWLASVPLALATLWFAYQQRPAQQTPQLAAEEGR